MCVASLEERRVTCALDGEPGQSKVAFMRSRCEAEADYNG